MIQHSEMEELLVVAVPVVLGEKVAELKVAERKVRRKWAASPVDLAEFESRAELELDESLR